MESSVSITNKDTGEYDVTINGATVTLPAGSEKVSKPNKSTAFGTPTKYLEVDAKSYGINLVENGRKTVIVPDTDYGEEDEREQIATDLFDAWRGLPKGGRKKKTRRHRKTRQRKTKSRGRK